ncbi:fatty acid desaturas-like protein [Rhexocercosporidium sp. MPI-PUGE-AT-0058]|nr:fatty acid desaturas-like protein [Rhexocercosporidium sp. MPI-PUGE-AT-0058]
MIASRGNLVLHRRLAHNLKPPIHPSYSVILKETFFSIMGWLKLGNRTTIGETAPAVFHGDLKIATEHVESVSCDGSARRNYVPVNTFLADSQLPFICPEEIVRRKSREDGGICKLPKIATDLSFRTYIIKSFGGAECSWQFWRFHGPKEMAEFGRPLRVGRTEGLLNKFKEPSKYVGLRGLGADE